MKIILLLFLLTFQGVTFASTAYVTEKIIVISIDALHPDAISAVKPQNIETLISEGIYTLKGKSVIPPKTLVSHTAMFTGLDPEVSGYTSNIWKKGENKIDKTTIFNDAKEHGFKTYYIYSKEKLGFLKNSFVDHAFFAGDESVYKAEEILKNEKSPFFMFLHISGLDFAGAKYGWLSKDYLEEFRYIDEDLEGIIKTALNDPKTVLIITSDHAGHERIHGTVNEEDMKLPLIILERNKKIQEDDLKNYRSSSLRFIIKKILE